MIVLWAVLLAVVVLVAVDVRRSGWDPWDEFDAEAW